MAGLTFAERLADASAAADRVCPDPRTALSIGDRVLVTVGPWHRVPGVVVRPAGRASYIVDIDGAMWTGFWFRETEMERVGP